MSKMRTVLTAILASESGTVTIETAIVLPVLGMLSLGGFEASQMVVRNTELQTAMSEATAIALTKLPETQSEIDQIEDILEASTGLDDEMVTMKRRYRCGVDEVRVDLSSFCADGVLVSEFIDISMTETYTPVWKSFGIGADVKMTVNRSVQIS